MVVFSDLRNLICLEERFLPFIETIEDRNIATFVGYYDALCDAPLTLKQLFLLNLGSVATIQRRLARLVAAGIIVKRRDMSDRRNVTLHLSSEMTRTYQRYGAAFRAANASGERGKPQQRVKPG